MPMLEKPLSGRVTAILLILFTVLMIPAAWYVPPRWSYLPVMFLMFLFIVTLGLCINGRPAGVLIDDRNLMSLSRFQMVLWTLLILSAFLTVALTRIKGTSIADALAIALDERLWGLMGISTASLVGTPLIHSTKKTQTPKPEEIAKTESALNATGDPEPKAEIEKNRRGVLYANSEIKDAAFTDMFQGDEVGNTAYIDLGKVQMFFFTIVAWLSYAVLLFAWIKKGDLLGVKADFPVLSGSFIAILGISHAGFLANKATTHTATVQ